MTVAAFMDLALYDPEFGYYARAPRRSGRAGDFFTSVDVGPLFGELLEVQIAEMAGMLTAQDAKDAGFDLVEVGAGNGRLAADMLHAASVNHPDLYTRTRLHLVEASAAARAAQAAMLGDAAGHLASSSATLPPSFEGVLVANELLDAMPVHQVVMREDGLHEVYVESSTGPLRLREAPLSTPALANYLDRLNVSLEPGWRVEINLGAVEWVRDAARQLRRGFIILIDYGHEARDLYSVSHAGGTLTTLTRHTMAGAESAASSTPWLLHPGEQDITAHVDFTSVRAAAEAEGCVTLAFLDQTYFLLGLASAVSNLVDAPNLANTANLASAANLKKRVALKTLVMPGGLGSTMKVLILGKGMGTPALRGCSFRVRAT